MNAVIAFVALLVAGPGNTKASEPVLSKDENHLSQGFVRGKETIRVDVWRRPFRKANHRIKVVRGVEEVDGHVPLGADGVLEALTTEISRVRVDWGGTTMDLSRELFQDCFNAPLKEGGIRVTPSDDFRAVLIIISGGDGAGAYEAHVVVSRDGFTTRFVAGEGGF